MEANELQQLELLCQAFYGGQSDHQSQAHNVLMQIVRDPTKVSLLQQVLANSSNLQALVFASSGIVSLFTNFWAQIPQVQKKETREFVLNYLYTRGPEMLKCAPEILGQLIHLLCKTIKLSWLDEINNQPIVNHVSQFLNATTPHWIIGLYIYTELTMEMQPHMGKNIAKMRRTALAFKESVLSDIFKVAIQTLEKFHGGQIQMGDNEHETQLLQQVLQLCVNCLSFDFMATMPDETSEEQTTVMVPQAWDVLRTDRIPMMLFELYKASCATPRVNCARLCLQSLVVIAALRKSFFNSDSESMVHLNCFMRGTLEIVKNNIGLSDDDCYHELCRLVGKINAANQLSQLLSSSCFAEWTDALHKFTLEALKNWSHLPNSKHYLLGVWTHMVVPLGYLREKVPPVLETFMLQITMEFISSRMALAQVIGSHAEYDFDNILSDETLVAENVAMFSRLCRCQYQSVCVKINELFDQLPSANKSVYYEKLSWLVLLVGSMLSGSAAGRLTIDDSPGNGGSSNISIHQLNVDLSGKVFMQMAISDADQQVPEHLELSYLNFLGHFRKFFIGEHARGTISGDYKNRFAKVPGCPPGMDGATYFLNKLVEKIIFNLQHRSMILQVLKKSLAFFSALASGIDIVHYADRSPHLIISGRLILQCETLRFAMANHSDPSFRFLSIPSYGRYRSIYYSILSKLLLMELTEDSDDSDKGEECAPGAEAKFEIFMEPLRNVIDGIQAKVESNPNALVDSETCQALVGLLRDLRGICKSCASPESYNMLFKWLVNKPKLPGKSRLHLLKIACDKLWREAAVAVPLLKCVAEIADNRARRISFEKTSANGILLFKEASGIVVSYAVNIIHVEGGYREKYKGIAAALAILNHCLSGEYVSFGVFDVYGDTSLDDALGLALSMCLAIPLNDLQGYHKSMSSLYEFLELATRHFMTHVLALPLKSITSLLEAIQDGLCSFEANVSHASASALDNFVTYLYKEKDSTSPDLHNTVQAINKFLEFDNSSAEGSSNTLRRTLALIFNLLVRGDCNSAWSISRPMLGLILLCNNHFAEIQESFSSQIAPEKQQKLARSFNSLMNGIDKTLSSQNKDYFTKNVYIFAQDTRLLFN
ncbi:Exportin-7 [Babesia microti strain RI]|uniref:Exportin-7 n=1 Tax=Babesia microti (strain RI) TaxID=1133968 RepID=I7J7Y4_BABMR|nr:Exportin-7 [Babesia microti strain RI]CCF72534.1 Exportin-7 [Babesia microti strain RI]|eukprot:XP_012647143.1 Exportin-7 [Babesia microti strain RI]